MDEETYRGEKKMKYSKLNAEERKWFANECCKTRQKEHIGFNKNYKPLEIELIEYMELYEALQDRKRQICDKYFEHK